MDIDTITKIVLIIGGITQAIRLWQQIISGEKKDNQPINGEKQTTANQPTKVIANLMVAIGVVLFLYGAINFTIATADINSALQTCAKGHDPNYLTQLCLKYINPNYQNQYNLGLTFIGLSFVISAITLFIQNLKTATAIQFTLEIIWLGLGMWLIIFKFWMF